MDSKDYKIILPDHSAVEKAVAEMDTLRESIIRDWHIPRSVLIDEMSQYPSTKPLTFTPQNDSNNEKEKDNMAKSKANINTKEEEWIWVEGYKGTDKDMQCHGKYQYELGKQFDMPEGADIETCHSGFHFCRDFKDVLNYVEIGKGNRFFKVHALVRKKDYNKYGLPQLTYWNYTPIDKLAAKSIVFIYELTADEVFAQLKANGVDKYDDWSMEDKALAMEKSTKYVTDNKRISALVSLGYSNAFAIYIIIEGLYDAAYAVGTQTDLSMDMKVAFILREED